MNDTAGRRNMTSVDYVELTDEMIDEARKLIGVPLRRSLNNVEATRGSIQAWARTIGDRNPLWLDETHAYRSHYGIITAHPCWLYSVDNTVIAPKLAGIHSLYAGTDWEFYREVRLGDQFRVAARLVDVVRKSGEFCGPMVLQVGEILYINQRSQIVARATSKVMRTPRGPAVGKGKYSKVGKHRYTPEEVLAIEEAYDKEEIRGENPRYWEDIEAGESLSSIVKAFLNAEAVKQFVCATSPAPTFGRFLEYRKKHPAAAFHDAVSGTWNDWADSLLQDSIARMFGFPFAHDTGIQRICWLGSLVANWMGDDARLRKLGAELRFPNFYGDNTWCKGSVVRKYTDKGEYLVDLKLWCENQDGIVTTGGGYATVALPSKSVEK
jgi:acyl dehydratase